jgi:hypothetical protein
MACVVRRRPTNVPFLHDCNVTGTVEYLRNEVVPFSRLYPHTRQLSGDLRGVGSG